MAKYGPAWASRVPAALALVSAMAVMTAACAGGAGPGTAASPKATPSKPVIKVEPATARSLHAGYGIRQQIQYAKVTGLPDQAVAAKVNERLRRAPEQVLDSWQDDITDGRDAGTGATPATTTLRAKAAIGLAGPRVVSVNHTFETDGADLGRQPAVTQLPLVLDLTTGRELATRDLLSEKARTPEGARALERVIARHGPGGRLCDQAPPGTRGLRPDDIVSDDPREDVVIAFPDRNGVRFMIGLWKLGYPMSCLAQPITVPYADLKGLLAGPLA